MSFLGSQAGKQITLKRKWFINSKEGSKVIDHYEKVGDEESAHCAREIACKEGLFVGYTSGACLQALKQLNKNNIFQSDSVVVSIFCDHGSRYMSKIYSDKWMEEQGFTVNKTKEQFSSIEYINQEMSDLFEKFT